MKESNTSVRIHPPLLRTNLRIPQLHGELISRSILLSRMDQAFNYPLTLISAPAGFGKTTLLGQWIEDSMSRKPDHRVAWVSLENDCDAGQFWRYVTTALDGLQMGIPQAFKNLPDTHQPPANTVLRILINGIAAVKNDLVLILDDYDRAGDPAIHTGLMFFINHLPTNMHIVIASRSYPALPLARWRASSQLYELREDDLRFSSAEITAFFNVLKGLDLSEENLAALGWRTEGWIAGLQLVALSLRDADEMAKRRFVQDFTGSQRYILDYLVEEVLQQQPENIRTFLLQTSVLDRLSAPLCDMVTGRSDSQAVLEYLERSHLFTIPMDQERRWYRYHNLFLDVLRHRLQQSQPDFIQELHRRAAAWYENTGKIEDAIRHACAGRDWKHSVQLIEPVISTVWNQGEVRKIISWLGKLPSEHLDAHPKLSLYYSRALLLGGKMDAAGQRLRESEKVLRAHPGDKLTVEDRLLLGTICAFRTTIAAVTGETASALELGHEALSLLPPENIDLRAHVKNSLGVNYYYLGDVEEAEQACAEAGKLALQAGNLYLAMVTASYRAKALICQGQLARAGQVLQQALDPGSTPGQSNHAEMPAASVVCSSFGDLLYEWNRLEEAEKYATEAIELGQRLAFGSALWSAYHTLARIKLARGDLKGAEAEIGHAQSYRLAYSVPLPARLMDAEEAGLHLALGHVEAAASWATRLQPDQPGSPGFVQEVENMTLARLYLIQDQPELALKLLDQLSPQAEFGGRKGHLIEIRLMTALAHHAMNNQQPALDILNTALAMSEPEGYLRIFFDAGQPMAALLYQALQPGQLPGYVSRLLAQFPAQNKVEVLPTGHLTSTTINPADEFLIEPLTDREVEVLQLIAGGSSNEEIAEKLVIAPTTAKKHVSNILHKLGAENRTQAVARGRSLGLCQ